MRKNRDYLFRDSGIPSPVLDDWENWLHVLDHGFCRNTGFDLESLTKEQLESFFGVLDRAGEPEFASLTQELERIREKRL